MILQDLIRTCRDRDFEKIEKIWDDGSTKIQIKDFCEMLLTLKPEQSEDVMLAVKSYYHGEEEVGADLFHKKDLMDKLFEISKKTVPSNFDTTNKAEMSDLISDFLHTTSDWVPQSYAYEFDEWEKVLGAEVIEENFSRYDKTEFLSDVLYELSFNGFSREEHDKRRNDLDESIEEMKQIMELPSEEQQKYIHSIDLDELEANDPRTLEEKESALRLIALDTFKCRQALLSELEYLSEKLKNGYKILKKKKNKNESTRI